MTMRRLRNWAYILMAYRYQIKYRPTAKHANADALSRLPIGPDVSFDEQDNNLHKVNTLILEDLDTTSINATVIGNLTKNDKLLNKVSSYIKKGWPVKLASNEKELKPFFEHYDRVIIPEALQSRALKYIHEGHWGCSRMKQLARRYIWFPDMDKQIEKLVANCVICQTSASNPKKEYVNWQPAENPWERIHLDFAGPFFNKMWLICVDSFSKFPFVVSLSSVTSESTIRALQMIFAIEGLPKTIVTDNGTQFTAQVFEEFCHYHSIQHWRTAPFHPASNGQAERFVRTFKEAFKKIFEEEKNTDVAVNVFLSTYRATPNPISQKSPAELLHGRQHRNLLSCFLPNQHKMSFSRQKPKFQPNQKVLARQYRKSKKWCNGVITSVLGSNMYGIQTDRGYIRRHQNQLRLLKHQPEADSTLIGSSETSPSSKQDSMEEVHQHASNHVDMDSPAGPLELRRSKRPKKAPVRFPQGC
ncbi:uncharacterized protein K02A2.6-like [Eupeodes corollae]|uniref:uncharacterized protein K02A2.6-like n=1 Tax=Eupeodes corollae TaxID=290404 RepID=UPI00249244B9|nr:uncharacterized protein K02A2.6-like [Eupeodes corollae]